MASWFTDLRRTALVALITTVLSVAYPGWNALRTSLALPWYFGVLAMVLGLLAIAIPVSFLFALYRSGATLRISKRLRSLALIAAVVGGIDVIPYVVTWLRSLLHEPRAISIIVGAIGWLSAAAYVLFLVAIFRHVNDAPRVARSSRLLLRVSQVMVLVWSLVLLGIVASAIYVAIEYPYFQNLASQSGRIFPPLRQEMLDRLRILLSQALLLVPPYIIYRSLRQMPANEPAE